jgi:anthranilate synthase/aminodeoxychorismate synthase-like glutamine amidotransferase
MRVLVLDNYDSFTYNLVQYLGELGASVDVVRNDAVSVDELVDRAPDRAVCLGHQAMAQAFGGRVVRGDPVHGKTASVEHDGRTIFSGLESPLVAGRYHSLVVDPALPDELEVSARSGDTVMGIRHRELPCEGVQFHPESVLTADGKALLRNFLA